MSKLEAILSQEVEAEIQALLQEAEAKAEAVKREAEEKAKALLQARERALGPSTGPPSAGRRAPGSSSWPRPGPRPAGRCWRRSGAGSGRPWRPFPRSRSGPRW